MAQASIGQHVLCPGRTRLQLGAGILDFPVRLDRADPADDRRPVVKPKTNPSDDRMVMTTHEVRRKLKIVAALSRETMKQTIERLVEAEFRKLVSK
jgi:hypothetical protein